LMLTDEQETFINSNLSNRIEYNWTITPDQDKRVSYFISESLRKEFDPRNSLFIRAVKSTTDVLNGLPITSNVYFDDDPNHTLLDNVAGYDYKTLTTNTYTSDFNEWLFKLTSSETITQIPNASPDISNTYYEYYGSGDPQYPLLMSITTRPNYNSSFDIKKSFEYDLAGNVIKETMSAPNSNPSIDPRIVSYEYSGVYDYRFNTKLTRQNINGPDLTENYGPFDEILGVPNVISDYNNLSTSISYDNFGRETGLTFPDGTQHAIGQFPVGQIIPLRHSILSK